MNTTQNNITIVTFYKFAALSKPWVIQAQLKEMGSELGLKGTILLAKEGINSTLAGPDAAIQAMLDKIQQIPEIGCLSYQFSYVQGAPFKRYFVKLKREIVALGMPEIVPGQQATGIYVDPQEWNQLLADPDVLVLDVRNDYEVDMGTFTGAQNPHTAVFREFPDYVQRELAEQKQRKVAMFCTGGVRCEKASAYMLQQGFTEVYHLKGGILNYLNTITPAESQWQGDCFVFDDRIVL